jgi:LmbE family N-acetylglucosaminyl deacetylase
LWPASGNPFAFPDLLEREGLEPWSPRELWLMEHPTSNHAVDVTPHFDAKIDALMCHQSQHPDPERIARIMRSKLTATAEEYGFDDGALAEKYAVYPLP